jgi:PadR family transcriptional regulator, regulatory protein PadR
MATDVQITATVAKVLRAFLDDPTAPRYGMELIRVTGLPSGTIYPVLARLEHAEWLVSEKEAIDPLLEGRPPRRYYTLSPEGAARARHEVRALAEELHFDSPPATKKPLFVPGRLAGTT